MDEKHVKMIERIHSELVGDEFTDGLIPEFKRVKKQVDTHEILIRAISLVFIIFAAVAAFWEDVEKVFN